MAPASGHFVLRVPPALHHRLRAAAALRERSLNQLCVELLGRGVDPEIPPASPPEIATEAAPPELVTTIARRLRGRLEGLVLFGSAARGEQWASSDVDLLVVLRPGVPLTRGLYSNWDANIAPWAASLGRSISPHFVALPRDADHAGGLWLEVALDGVILFDPRLRVARLLSRLRRQIAAGAVVRELAHGQPYWRRRARTA